jgi:hypothetical protein
VNERRVHLHAAGYPGDVPDYLYGERVMFLARGDFEQIEARVLPWLAGAEWKLDAFRRYDTIIPGQFDANGKPMREGPDLYRVAAANI